MSNPFSDILSSIPFLNKNKDKDKSVIGVDIGTSAIKIVQLGKKKGKAVLETYGSISLGPYAKVAVGQSTNLSAEMISQALTDVIKEANVTTNIGAIAVPSSASLISLISLPGGLDKDKLSAIIPTEARKYIPVPISEVTLDWWTIPAEVESFENNSQNPDANPEAKTEVLIVAIHNEVLAKYQEILSRTNLVSNFFEIEVFSLIRSTISHELTSILLIDFGASKTKLSIVEYGIVKTFHIVNRGSQDITNNIAQSLNIPFEQAEKLKRETGLDRTINRQVAEIVESSLNYILSEINTIVLNYEKRYNKNISKVILSGGGALTKGLSERAMNNFRAEVIFGNPFEKAEAPAFLESVLKTSGPEFSVAIGIALRSLQ